MQPQLYYILITMQVDCHTPDELHDELDDLPIFPESIVITDEMCSPTTAKMRSRRYGRDIKYSQKKLAPNFYPKTGYICHIASLQQYVKLGGVIDKVHRVLEFRQSSWLEDYIQFNTNKRKAAKSDFEKAFFKLMVGVLCITLNFVGK